MKPNLRKPAILVVTMAAGVALAVGCTQGAIAATGSDANGSAASASAVTSGSSDGSGSSMAQWKEEYPLEYYSFANGGDVTDDLSVISGRQSFSHATMATYMAKRIADGDGALRGVCIACKSSKYNELYAEYGDAVFDKDASTVYAEAVSADDYWDCTTCHSYMSDPAGSVGAQVTLYQQVGATLLAQLDPKTATCAQCHNNANTWMSNILTGTDSSEMKDPYRYGWDADAMMKAVLEDKADAKTVIDEKTGAYIIADGGHPDVEMFQGSVMQQAGLTCTDCHMPTVESIDGVEYTSHDASKSPLDSYTSLSKCLECHQNQGIENAQEMYDFVRNAQQEVADLDSQVVDKLAALNTAIGAAIDAGTATDETLDAARDSYAKAAYYRAYVLGNNGATPVDAGTRGEAAGEKVAHNPQMSREYLQRAIALIDDSMATLA